jgi:hypothetical protein
LMLRLKRSSSSILVACLVGGVGASSVLADQGKPAETASSVTRRIDAIMAKYPGVEADELDESLMDDEQMKFIVDNPQRFQRAIDDYVHLRPAMSEVKARTAILGLQCLPLADYLAFVDRLSASAGGTVSPWALFYSVVPGVEWSTRLQMNYANDEVRETLRRAADSPNASKGLRKTIVTILSGDTARSLKRLNERPRLHCD